MALSHISKVFAAADAKIYPMTADPAGGTTTYGTGIDVPGIKTVEISGDINSVELRGDNSLLDVASSLTNIQVAAEWAKQSLDILAAFFSNTVTDSGTTPNQKALWSLLGTSQLGNFGLSCKAVGADTVGGDVHFILPKLILSSFPEMGLAEEDYRTSTTEFRAMPLLSNGKWLDVVFNETAAALAAPVAP